MSDKITANWLTLAKYDMDTAGAMFETKRYLYVAFMCQQAIEKMLKAFYVKEKQTAPPYTHNLLRIARELLFFHDFDSEKLTKIEVLNSYYIESRYTEDVQELVKVISKEKAAQILSDTKELFEWLRSLI